MGCKDTQNYYLRASNYSLIKVHRYYETEIFYYFYLATGRAVVACPGGGYSHLAFEHEGCDWAPYFNKQGIALIVLKYRMPNGDRTLPISDAEAAMKLVRDSADVWNLNPNDIGIMGSSAGGHLASTIATQAKTSVRPTFHSYRGNPREFPIHVHRKDKYEALKEHCSCSAPNNN